MFVGELIYMKKKRRHDEESQICLSLYDHDPRAKKTNEERLNPRLSQIDYCYALSALAPPAIFVTSNLNKSSSILIISNTIISFPYCVSNIFFITWIKKNPIFFCFGAVLF